MASSGFDIASVCFKFIEHPPELYASKAFDDKLETYLFEYLDWHLCELHAHGLREAFHLESSFSSDFEMLKSLVLTEVKNMDRDQYNIENFLL